MTKAELAQATGTTRDGMGCAPVGYTLSRSVTGYKSDYLIISEGLPGMSGTSQAMNHKHTYTRAHTNRQIDKLMKNLHNKVHKKQ